MRTDRVRPAERYLLIYFAYSIAAVLLLGGLWWRVTAGAALAIVVIGVTARIGSDTLRDWLPVLLIPPAYWQMDYVRSAGSAVAFDHRWALIDGWLLQLVHGSSTAALVSSWVLESAYALTYVIPLIAIAAMYWSGRRDRVDCLHAILFAGTLAVYALLPWSRSLSPRLIALDSWQPPLTAIRAFNVWLLDRLDISTSVFPSGHVAVAWSAGFGLLSAMPGRRAVGGAMLLLATLVSVATVYGRYHYTVDVVASLAVSVAVWSIQSRRLCSYREVRR